MITRENWLQRDSLDGALIVEDIGVDLFGEPFRVLTGPFFSWEDAEHACRSSETASICYMNLPWVEA